MKKTNKLFLEFGLGIVTLWDLITTVYGTKAIAGDGIAQFLISVGFGIGISIVLLRTMPIIKNPKEDFFSITSKGIWFIVLLYDLYTAYLGNFNILLSTVDDTPKILIAIGLTLLCSYSPMYLSYLYYNTSDDEGGPNK